MSATARAPSLALRGSCSVVIALLGILVWTPMASGYQWYDNGAGVGCVDCHAGFSDGLSGELHAAHVDELDISDCDTCHPSGPGSTPVLTYSSGAGLGCAGCHGRDYGENSTTTGQPKASGWGLRQHHENNLETSCQGCHGVGPAILPESVPPPYYGLATNNLTDPCDGAQEDMTFDGDSVGLDNDGDGVPDFPSDPDCGTPTTTISTISTISTTSTITTISTTSTFSTTSTTTTLPPGAISVGITGKKLIIVDKLTAAGRAKIVYVAKDTTAAKGMTNDPGQISATLAYQVPMLGASGSAAMPQGPHWLVNKQTVAKYVNKDAPAAGGAVKVGVVKPGKLLKAVLKDLGDAGTTIDIYQGGATTTPVDAATQFTVVDGATTVRHCGEFTGCARKIIAGGDGAKVVCKNATPGASVSCP